MDNRAEVREFLISRRAKITPAEAGLPDVGARRVPGLRRGEVAALAGVSIEYYSKLERGSLAGVSASVLDAIARALQLDDAERAHLFHLAAAADGTSAIMRPRRRTTKRWTPRPSLQWTLDAITTGPAIVRNGRMDLLATNHLGRAMHSSLYDERGQRTAELRPLHLPRRRLPPVLPRLGPRRRHLRRHPAHRSRPRPVRQGTARPRRRAVHPQRGLPPPLEHPQRPPPRRRDQALPPPGRRRPHPRVRKPGHGRRTRTHHDHLRRRTELTHRRRPGPARLLGRHPRS